MKLRTMQKLSSQSMADIGNLADAILIVFGPLVIAAVLYLTN